MVATIIMHQNVHNLHLIAQQEPIILFKDILLSLSASVSLYLERKSYRRYDWYALSISSVVYTFR